LHVLDRSASFFGMSTSANNTPESPINFETHPSQYKHLRFEVDGPVARIILDIKEDLGLREGYELKLNSYDLSVDIELNDAVNRLRFEHPEVASVVITSAISGVFSSGANIFMLGSSDHGFKVNFCKYTNETRLGIEDATRNGGQTYICACNGLASGGGYELALACEEIYLVDDRRSAVSLPEIPYLGVLPGTGGLTRLVDKRMVRRDLADVFVTLAEGIKGRRAAKWNLVDGVFPSSRFDEAVAERAKEVAGDGHDRRGVALEALNPTVDEDGIHYQHVDIIWGDLTRTAELRVKMPSSLPDIPAEATELGCNWGPFRMFRELDDALIRLRFNHPEIGVVLLRTKGDVADVRKMDEQLLAHRDHWFVDAVVHHMKRVYKRLDYTSKSLFAMIDEGSCFVGSLFELTISADRSFMLEEDGVTIGLTEMNEGVLPMGNGLSRLQTRFLGALDHAEEVAKNREDLGPEDAEELGLVTFVFDEIDWEDEVRLAIEERASLSPDALTGSEANLRFAGPETLETKIFGRLSAWQNWIFHRPNATGERGALTLYGHPERAVFDYRRT
jgi:benzoyl-CoA-dihydrodiol lyase